MHPEAFRIALVVAIFSMLQIRCNVLQQTLFLMLPAVRATVPGRGATGA